MYSICRFMIGNDCVLTYRKHSKLLPDTATQIKIILHLILHKNGSC